MPAIMAYAVIKGDAKKAMGSVISILTVAHSMGMLTGSIVAGLAMDYLNLRLSFPCGTIIMILGTFIFWILTDKRSYIKK
jgi:predicted MFS family arabinose efflux permease